MLIISKCRGEAQNFRPYCFTLVISSVLFSIFESITAITDLQYFHILQTPFPILLWTACLCCTPVVLTIYKVGFSFDNSDLYTKPCSAFCSASYSGTFLAQKLQHCSHSAHVHTTSFTTLNTPFPAARQFYDRANEYVSQNQLATNHSVTRLVIYVGLDNPYQLIFLQLQNLPMRLFLSSSYDRFSSLFLTSTTSHFAPTLTQKSPYG